jgi:CubicO group peptidase (beta-lactamase class C family)
MAGLRVGAALRWMAASFAVSTALASSSTWAETAKPLVADAAQELGEVAGFTAVHDWTVSAGADLIRVAAPEGDLAVTVIDLGRAADARAAAAMAIAKAGAKSRPLEVVAPRAPIDGWDERAVADYTVPPGEHAMLEVTVLRRGDHWVALVLDGSQATGEKRGAALGLMTSSLRPKGFAREDFSTATAHKLTPERIKALTDFVADALVKLQVPGAGIALIQDGKIVWEGGVGVKALGGTAPVGAHTRFMIASNTKGMSTLLLARLVDEGRLRWDQPVTQVYPGFRLGSAETTDKVVMRQLVCACTGLPRKDMEWLFATRPDTPASDTFVQLAETAPTSKFGEVFQYNNLMASAAGYVGGHIAYPALELGAAYDKAMQTRVFGPLGMADTTFDFTVALAADHADPSALALDGRPVALAQTFNRQIPPFRPAGGAWSSAHDVARYVQLELGEGQLPDGTRMVSAANLLERRRKNVPAGEDTFYGMGLEVRHRYGVDVVFHGGSLAGYKSNWFALPGARTGAVVLTNSDEGGNLLDPLLRRLIEVLYDGRPEAAARVAAAAQSTQAEMAALRAKLTLGEDAIAAQHLAASYRNASLGRLQIVRENGISTVRIGGFIEPFAIQHNPDRTDSVVVTGADLLGVDALIGTEKGKRTLTMRDGQHVYVFTEG